MTDTVTVYMQLAIVTTWKTLSKALSDPMESNKCSRSSYWPGWLLQQAVKLSAVQQSTRLTVMMPQGMVLTPWHVTEEGAEGTLAADSSAQYDTALSAVAVVQQIRASALANSTGAAAKLLSKSVTWNQQMQQLSLTP